MPTPHAQAVLALCDKLAATGHTVISANTDERGTPQVFAQSETGELAFYFMSIGVAEPTDEKRAQALALAAKHGVSAYWCRAPRADGAPDPTGIEIFALSPQPTAPLTG